MNPSRLVAGLAAVGILVAGFFLVRSLDDDLVYFLTTGEAVEQRAAFADGRAFRLSGIVAEDSVRNPEPGVTLFDVTDGGATIPVRLVDTPPPLFEESIPVLLSGAWQGEVFVADEALIRHEADYSAPSTGNYPG